MAYLASFSTPSHHVLVLEYVPGGELFDLVAEQHRRIRLERARRHTRRQLLLSRNAELAGEGERLVEETVSEGDEDQVLLTHEVVRRIWGELCKAVGWMHGVGLVHRDIKLESTSLTLNHPCFVCIYSRFHRSTRADILLTTPLPAAPLPAPLIKLTDFGLSRFLPPPVLSSSSPSSQSQLLTTLCGSESYAAPELVCGGPYDGRATDAWACGVVLFAIVTGGLPFDRPPQEREADPLYPESQPRDDRRARERERKARKALLVRIASAQFVWPAPVRPPGSAYGASDEDALDPDEDLNLASEGVKSVVGRLLVREWKRRARIDELWDEEWMNGPGAPARPVLAPADADMSADGGAQEPGEGVDVQQESEVEQPCEDEAEDADCDADVETDEGILVDGQEIGPESVARQEH